MPIMTRAQAKIIAEELYKLMRKDILFVVQETTIDENEEYLTSVEAAKMLGWSIGTLYNRKKDIGSYIKVGNQLRFPKTKLKRIIESGRLKGSSVCQTRAEYQPNVKCAAN